MSNRKTNPGDYSTRIALMILMVFFVTACASDRVVLLPGSEKMTIQTGARPAEVMHATTDRNTVVAGEKSGAKVGLAAGALYSTMLCGPAAFACFVVYGTGGAVMGMSAGGMLGMSSDAFDLFPPKTAERVETILLGIEDRRDFFYEIRDALVDSVPQDRQADFAVADVVVYVGPEEFELVQDESGLFALRVTASLLAEWKRGEEMQRTEKRRYEYVTSEKPVAYWLHNNGEALDRGFTECVQKVTQMMSWDIVLPAS